MGSACHQLRGYRLVKESGGDRHRLPVDRNGAALLARELLRADEIFMLAGEQVNPCYQNPLLPRHITIRHNLLEQLVETLSACNKNVKIEWC
jgi:hypothetical protein